MSKDRFAHSLIEGWKDLMRLNRSFSSYLALFRMASTRCKRERCRWYSFESGPHRSVQSMERHKVSRCTLREEHEPGQCRQTKANTRSGEKRMDARHTLVFRSIINFCKSVRKTIRAGMSTPKVESRSGIFNGIPICHEHSNVSAHFYSWYRREQDRLRNRHSPREQWSTANRCPDGIASTACNRTSVRSSLPV